MAQMSWSPRTRDTFLHEVDLLLLRRHRLVENNLTPEMINCCTFPTEAWARVHWLRNNGYEDSFVYATDLTFAISDLFPEEHEKITGNRVMFLKLATNQRAFLLPNDGRVTFHHDSQAAPHVINWAKAQLKVAQENIRAYDAISKFINSTTTWLQVKKHWPELTATIEGMRKANYYLADYIPDMRELDPKRAMNLPAHINEMVAKDSDHVVKTCLQALMLPKLDERMDDYRRRDSTKHWWVPFRTRAMYYMNGIKETSSYHF
jgi:hypothetical protein